MTDSQNKQYEAIMSEIISKQAVILGPEMAIMRARNLSVLEIDDEGKVLAVQGDPSQALQQLVDEYVALSGQIVKNALGSIFDKYPNVKYEGQ